MSVQSTLTGLADEVRELSGETSTLTLDQMTESVSEANEEVSSQSDTIEEIQAALEGRALVLGARSTGSSSAEPRYGKAVCFGSAMCASSDGSKGLMDYVAESGAYESITTYADSSYTVIDLPGLVDAHVTDIQDADIVFLEFGMNEIMLIEEEGPEIFGSASMSAMITGTANKETLCGILHTAIGAITEINPAAKIVWLAPFRWTGYSDTIMSSLMASGSISNVLYYIAILGMVEDITLMLEATLLRVVRNCGGSIVDLGMPAISIMFEDVTDEIVERMAQPIISNPFRDEPAPALHKTISVFAEGAEGIALVTSPEILYLLAIAGVDLRMEMLDTSGMTTLPVLRYNGTLTTDSAMAFSTILDTQLISASLLMTQTADMGCAVEIGTYNLTTTTTTETTETTES